MTTAISEEQPLPDTIVQDVEMGPTPSHSEANEKANDQGRSLTKGDSEMPDIPDNKLWLVIPTIALTIFVPSMDQNESLSCFSIVAVALPSIAEKLSATPAQYSWVGTAYLLGTTAATPFYGRIADLLGFKPLLCAAIVGFIAFSAMCGAAKSIVILIVGRAFQGIAGGGIIVSCITITSEIVPLQKRALYTGLINSSSAVAAAVGPIIGGALAQKVSWRWCFYINLPTSGIALLCLVFTLKLNTRPKTSLDHLLKTFDFAGLFLLVAGAGLTTVGFSLAADNGFGNPAAYALIIVGAVVIVAAVINVIYTKRHPIMPPRIFTIRTTSMFLLAASPQSTVLLPTTYLLPQLFIGLRGASPITAGISVIPFAILISFSSIASGWLISKYRLVRSTAWVGYALTAIGFGLFYRFMRYDDSYAVLEGLQVIPSIGIGLSILSPLIAMQAAMPLNEAATVTSAFLLGRPLGATIGLASSQAILNAGIRSRFQKIPGYGVEFQAPTSQSGYAAFHEINNPVTKALVLTAFADAVSICWIVNCAVMLCALAITLPTKSYTLDRQRGPNKPASDTPPGQMTENEVAKLPLDEKSTAKE